MHKNRLPRTREGLLREIRYEALRLGLDFSNMTNDNIEQSILKIKEELKPIGIPVKEAVDMVLAVLKMQKAVKN